MTIKKEILYPIFLECCIFTIDVYWSNIFDDLSYGICPHGMYISNNFLACNYTNKEFNYKIERKNIELLYNDIYTFLTVKLNLFSPFEKNNQVNKIQQVLTLEQHQTWASIKKKNIKDILVEKYVIDVSKKYCLSQKKIDELLSLIIIAFIFRVITQKDIDYSTNKIHNIRGISFEKNTIINTRVIYSNISTDNMYSELIFEDKKLMSDNWVKYINKILPK